MNKALDFLKENREVAFATSENNIPKIRVFQIMWQEGKELYFATSPHKEVAKQLNENPNVELLAMRNNISVRVVGRAIFDLEDEMCQRIYDSNEVLPRLYKSVVDLVYFRVTPSEINYFDLIPNPPLFESFKF